MSPTIATRWESPIPPRDDRPIPGMAIDEWLFAAWTPDGSTGVIAGHRLLGKTAWYWAAHVRTGYRLLTLSEHDVKVRDNPMVVKAHEMWAENICEEPLRQWSIGNEAYFAELDRPLDALGRAYGIPRPTAFDLEWYAIDGPLGLVEPNVPTAGDGFWQSGVVHGVVEVLDRTNVEFVEAPALRWRRWTTNPTLQPVSLPRAVAHTGLRAPFAFADGATVDWVLNPAGWCQVDHRRPPTVQS